MKKKNAPNNVSIISQNIHGMKHKESNICKLFCWWCDNETKYTLYIEMHTNLFFIFDFKKRNHIQIILYGVLIIADLWYYIHSLIFIFFGRELKPCHHHFLFFIYFYVFCSGKAIICLFPNLKWLFFFTFRVLFFFFYFFFVTVWYLCYSTNSGSGFIKHCTFLSLEFGCYNL